MMLLPTVCAFMNTRRLSLTLWYSTFVVYLLFIGLRYDVGADWEPYVYIHSIITQNTLWDVLARSEPLSYGIIWLSATLGYDVYLTNFIAAFITLAGVFAFARCTVNPWLALITTTPYFLFVMGMSGIRQTMAAGVVLFLFSRWDRYSLIRRGGLILIAAMFHTSALINNLFLILKMNIPLRFKVVLGIAIFMLTVYLGMEVAVYADNIDRYQDRYFGQSVMERSFSSLYHIAMIAIPALLALLFRRRIRPYIHNSSLLQFGILAALVVAAMSFMNPTVASRLSNYLYFLPMMIYPALVIGAGRHNHQMAMVTVVAFHFALLAVWFNFANHAFSYLPYRSILFDN